MGTNAAAAVEDLGVLVADLVVVDGELAEVGPGGIGDHGLPAGLDGLAGQRIEPARARGLHDDRPEQAVVGLLPGQGLAVEVAGAFGLAGGHRPLVG